MRRIKLSRGHYALVDGADFPRVSKYKWHYYESKGMRYAVRNVKGVGGRMHNFILGSLGVDHRNGDGLDNRRKNLRPATQQEQCRNRAPRKGSRSKFKGLTYVQKPRGGWAAGICIDGKSYRIGTFSKERDAALAYDYFAKYYFREFARLNFPRSSDKTRLNAVNRRHRRDSVGGCRGVSFHQKTQKWYGRLHKNSKLYSTRYFEKREDAVDATEKLRKKLGKKLEKSLVDTHGIGY